MLYLSLLLVRVGHLQASDINSSFSLTPKGQNIEYFQKLDEKSLVIHYGFKEDKVSFTLESQNNFNKPKQHFLIFLWSHLDEVEVCLKNLPCQKAGYIQPVSNWPIQQIFPTFPIELIPNENQSIDIHIKSKNYIESEIKLVSTEELFGLIGWYIGLVIIFFVIIFLFLTRLIFIYFKFRKRWMLYLIAFHFSILLVFIFGSGIANFYLFPTLSIPLSLCKKIIIGLLIITGSAWLSNYFETKKNHPIIYKIYQIAILFTFLLICLSFTETPRLFISVFYSCLYLGLTLLSLKLAISKLNDQLIPAPWLILSLLCLFTFEILNIFSYETFDSHDSKIYLFFLGIFLPANAFFVSRTIKSHIKEIESELTLSKLEIQKFKQDINQTIHITPKNDKKSHLNGVDIELILSKLNNLMMLDKVFREEELRLSDLAALLGLSVHQTSEVLNQFLNISFVDLIKKYRIEEAKRLLQMNLNKSVFDIALECGFTSKSVFNSAFRKYVAMTPLEYRKYISQNQ